MDQYIGDALQAMQGLLPVLDIIFVVSLGLGLVWYMDRYFRNRGLNEPDGEWEKPKRKQSGDLDQSVLNLADLSEPGKPKRMYVRLGDDGELVEWQGESHETNRQV